MKLIPSVTLGLLLLASAATVGRSQDYDRNARHEAPIQGQGHHSGREVLARFREHDQRIRDGLRSGELTHREADDIRSKEATYRQKFDDFMQRNHGYITDNEENSLLRSLDDLSGEIHRHKHDDKTHGR